MGALRRRPGRDGSRRDGDDGVNPVTDQAGDHVASVDGVMSVALTGPFYTAQLPRVAPDPVTITVARTVVPGREDDYLRWLELQVEAINHSLKGIPEERARLHICWAAGTRRTPPTCRSRTSSI